MTNMEKIKRSFLRDILHYEMAKQIQVMMANEYLGFKGKRNIFINDEDGLEKMLCTTDRSEIVRAICFGDYNFNDDFVKFNDYGNIISLDDVWDYDGVESDEMIDWLINGKEDDLANAYMILKEDDIADMLNLFIECFADEFDFERHIVSNWVYYNDISVVTICRENWSDLIDIFKTWVENEKERF